MKILLIAPRYNANPNAYYFFPTGMMYLSAYLKREGFNVDCLNLNHYKAEKLEEHLANSNYDVIGTGGLFHLIGTFESIVGTIKKTQPNAKIILGGPIGSGDPQFALEKLGADYVVYGEGEITTANLLRALENDSELGGVSGIAYIKDGTYIEAPPTPLIENLDSLPFPDYEGFEYGYYLDHFAPGRQSLTAAWGVESANKARIGAVITSRDCALKCTFCFRLMGGNYRIREIDRVIEEIIYLIDNYKIDEVYLLDDMFAASKERVLEFCQKIKPLNLRWVCQLRVTSVDENILKAMKESGCHLISYGFESGSQSILKSMKKGISPKLIQKAAELTREAKVEIQGNFIFGDPAETLETVDETIRFINRVFKSISVGVGLITPYPGTPLYKALCAEGKIPDVRAFHLAPGRINMTKMSAPEFDFLEKKISAFGELRYIKFTGIVKSVKKLAQGEFEVAAQCPHCGIINTCYANFNRPEEMVRVGENLHYKCRDCYQRFFVSAVIYRVPFMMNFRRLRRYMQSSFQSIFYTSFKGYSRVKPFMDYYMECKYSFRRFKQYLKTYKFFNELNNIKRRLMARNF